MKVLLTNDDGPPNTTTSPYVFAFYKHLLALGWDVRVVLPSSQKSWIGKAFHITEITEARYFYPTGPDGLTGETSPASRPLKDGEVVSFRCSLVVLSALDTSLSRLNGSSWMELLPHVQTLAYTTYIRRKSILLSVHLLSCVSLHRVFVSRSVVQILAAILLVSFNHYSPIDSHGFTAAFALSSGTIGAAMSASLSKTRSIALSYGTVVHPTPVTYFDPSHDKGGLKSNEIDLYNVNIPMVEDLLTGDGLKILWTSMWRNSYGRLFKAVSDAEPAGLQRTISAAGPDALTMDPSRAESTSASSKGKIAFQFSPAMEGLIRPAESSVPIGSDGWAMLKGGFSNYLTKMGQTDIAKVGRYYCNSPALNDFNRL
ncbi:hypothetical protein B0H10DRAFT_2058435 [Mycena sp. CBHHK59/15]|nr:hypothetical protein B0H10DRAFT_2058435 [Mycena sp. CBHHK59/15]